MLIPSETCTVFRGKLHTELGGFVDGFHPERLAIDKKRIAVMQEAVQDRGGHDIISEDLAPLLEGLVRCNDDGALLVALGDELEEELGCLASEREIAEFIDDEEVGTAQLIEESRQAARDLGSRQLGGELLGGVEQHPFACLGRLQTQGDRQVGLAHTGCADQEDVLGSRKKLQCCQFADQFLIDLGLKAEVKFFQALDLRESCQLDAPVDGPFDLGEHLLLQEPQEVVLVTQLGLGGVLRLLKIDLPHAVQRERFEVGVDLIGIHGCLWSRL